MEITITWNICRVCLAEEENKPQVVAVTTEAMHHIFNEDEMLAKQIYECSGITMKPKDNLPEKICNKCYTLMKYALNFRETCRASDTYLQNILQCTKSASALLKKQQPPSEISSDCETVDKSNGDQNEIPDKPERQEAHLEKSSKRLSDLEYSDIIEIENESFINDDDFKKRVKDNVLDYTGSGINEFTVQHDESDDCEIVLQINNSLKQNRHLNEEIEYFKHNNDGYIIANREKDDHNVKNSEQFEELILPDERNPCDIESESEDSQKKVSSTVAIIEDGKYEIIGLEAEDTQLSGETLEMQTEYIIDELLIDDNNHDSKSLQSSAAQYVHLKKIKSVVNKYETHKNQPKNVIHVTASSKAGNDIKVWVCDMCGNHFSNRQLLNSHIKVHRQEKNHECEICLKRFITACNLQAHMRIHTGEKPFECKYCGRRFSDRSSNLRHERTHTNEKPFECKLCGKAFSLGTTLKKHLKVHTGERSFRCDICAKSFKLPHQLKAHKNSTLHKAVEQLTQIDQ